MKPVKKEKPEIHKLTVLGEEYATTFTRKYNNRKPYTPVDHKKIFSFIPGTIKNVFVVKGQDVQAGDKLLTLEAMKMDNEILTTISGKIKEVNVIPGQMVTKSELLVELF
ncbi:MAG TPA: acetyl-CoA carboxylase biotin carboxyl carrier protein subunit [Bacteroidales bacterium]|nr:acetyl-CoA carboxylase biotin carboxyl carrier protein subunit [Bacteroidales bacterium]